MVFVAFDEGDGGAVLDDHFVHLFSALGHVDDGVDVRGCGVRAAHADQGELSFDLLVPDEGIGGDEDVPEPGDPVGVILVEVVAVAKQVAELFFFRGGDQIRLYNDDSLVLGIGGREGEDLVFRDGFVDCLISGPEDDLFALITGDRQIGQEHVLDVAGQRIVLEEIVLDYLDYVVGFAADCEGNDRALAGGGLLVIYICPDYLIRKFRSVFDLQGFDRCQLAKHV